MSENRVIGNGSQIPWHLPEDFKWFKQMTTGHIVVMGRTTFESIGRPLPNRETIVVSRSGFSYPGVRTVTSLDDIDVNADERNVFICGGAQIYALALPHCSDLYLTHVKQVVDVMKMREVYRHLSNAADRVDEAANVIAHIVIKSM